MRNEASCSCGQLKVIYDGEITRTALCHCLACQKRTGSVFGVQTRLEKSKSIITGVSTIYPRTSDDGNIVSFHFCPKCGSTVYYESEWLGTSIAVPIGAFANPEIPQPAMDIYRNRKHRWVLLPEDLKEYLG